MLMLLKIGLLLFQVLAMLSFLFSIWAYRDAFKWLRKSEPLRCTTIEEQRLLALYYPKETFDRDVRQHQGPYSKGGTMQDWNGMDLIGGLPVSIHFMARQFLDLQGENRIEVICGKKRAYVVRLNERYSIEGSAAEVEHQERINAQWRFGIPGPRLDDPATQILGQRRSTKKERRVSAYDVFADSPDPRRFLGCLAVALSCVLFWAMALEWLATSPGWYILGTLVAVGGWVPMTLEKTQARERINRIQGVYRKRGEQRLIGSLEVRATAPMERLMDHTLKSGQTLTADVRIEGSQVLYIEGSRVVHIDGLPDPYADWDYRQHERLVGNLVMLGFLAVSLALVLWLFPYDSARSNAQAWVHYASGGLFIAYAVNTLRRIRQRRAPHPEPAKSAP